MVKKCEFIGCNTIPSYNLSTEKIAIFCFDHKKENMINVKDKKCEYPDCNKIPAFNLETEKKAIFCGDHKKENMINIKNANISVVINNQLII